MHDRKAGGSEREDSLAVFVDGEEGAVEGVEVGGEHGEGLGQEDAQAQTAGVRVENVDASLDADGGGAAGAGPVRKG